MGALLGKGGSSRSGGRGRERKLSWGMNGIPIRLQGQPLLRSEPYGCSGVMCFCGLWASHASQFCIVNCGSIKEQGRKVKQMGKRLVSSLGALRQYVPRRTVGRACKYVLGWDSKEYRSEITHFVQTPLSFSVHFQPVL